MHHRNNTNASSENDGNAKSITEAKPLLANNDLSSSSSMPPPSAFARPFARSMFGRQHNNNNSNNSNNIIRINGRNQTESEKEQFIERIIKYSIAVLFVVLFLVSYTLSSSQGGGGGGGNSDSIHTSTVVQKKSAPSSQLRKPNTAALPQAIIKQEEITIINYPIQHPYRQHWPTFPLPSWAIKTYDSSFFNPSEIPNEKRVCLVHVGKTGGSTVGCALGFHLHCDDGGGGDLTMASSLLSKYTTNIFHANIYDCPDSNTNKNNGNNKLATTANNNDRDSNNINNDNDNNDNNQNNATSYYLFLLRNPLHRIQSAHAYDRPTNWLTFHQTMGSRYYNFRKQLYIDCPFHTLEELAMNGLTKRGNNASEECQRRARAALEGKEHYGCHFYYNYQFHWEGVPHANEDGSANENVKIVGIRTEHMMEDWKSVEMELGGGNGEKDASSTTTASSLSSSLLEFDNSANGDTTNHHNNVNTHTIAADKYLSPESKSLLCEILCNEIQIYKTILYRSININDESVQESLEELKESCPVEAMSTSCAREMPDIKEKLIRSRGYGNERGEEWAPPPPLQLQNNSVVHESGGSANIIVAANSTITKTATTAMIAEPTIVDTLASPYEQHWPGFTLPNYMKKDYAKYLPTVPIKQSMCFVHVGKTAGSTVGCALGFNLHCNHTAQSTLPSPGLLPQYSNHMFHAQLYDCYEESSHYFFVVRNPLDRLISAFNYDKPTDWDQYKISSPKYYTFRKGLYLDCPFGTVEELAQRGLSYLDAKDADGTNVTAMAAVATQECRRRAASAIDGTEHFGCHMYYNYQFHLEAIPKDARIMVIRTEHLVTDWNSAELLLSGRKDILGLNQTTLIHNNVNTASNEDEKYLSEESRILICKTLCNEIQVYKRILSESVNLSEEQVQQSILELAESCPIEAVATSCDDPLPDITEKLILGRGYEKGVIPTPFDGEISIGRSVYDLPPSPYELTWPNLKLPGYMRKDPIFDLNTVPADKKTCYVHVGKTAGSTVGCAIGYNLHCETKNVAPGVFPRYSTNMFHAQMYNCYDDSAYFVFVVRNPLDRLISAFNYDNPKDWVSFEKIFGTKHANFRKRLYLDCPFHTMEDLAQLGLSDHGNASSECKRRAAASIEGIEHFGCHFFFNYQYHLEAVPAGAKIMTIRTEHLVEDYNAVEYNLGGEENILGPNQTVLAHNNVNHAIVANATRDDLKYLSDDSRRLICKKLCNEIQTYKKILRLSINLSEDQVQLSISEMVKSCPVEAAATTCMQPLPNITDKLVNSRGYLRSKV